jgi:uncharacterized protein YutE (UPF0331/DUF86 family)
MLDKDIVLAKTAAIQRCLKRINDVTGLKPESLHDQDVQDIFVLNLQRAIQSAIDLSTHIIAAENLGLPDTIKENFELLEKAKIIGRDLSKRMQSMVGFRNIAIHEYQSLETKVLEAILMKRLKDLEEFYASVISHFRLSPEQE